MKKILVILLALAIMFAVCSCGNMDTNTETTVKKSKTPTIQDIVNGIKYEFKDPESVQMSDVHIAQVEDSNGEYIDGEYYVIGKVHAKNSFGGYGNPIAYIIHCDNGRYKIVGKYTDDWVTMQGTFNDLGCGPSWSLYN